MTCKHEKMTFHKVPGGGYYICDDCEVNLYRHGRFMLSNFPPYYVDEMETGLTEEERQTIMDGFALVEHKEPIRGTPHDLP